MNVSETDSGALDLSSGSRDRENMKSRSSVASHISHHSSSYQSEGKDFFLNSVCCLPIHWVLGTYSDLPNNRAANFIPMIAIKFAARLFGRSE